MNTQTHTGLHSLRCKYATIRTIHMGGGNVRGKYPRGKCPRGNVRGGNVRIPGATCHRNEKRFCKALRCEKRYIKVRIQYDRLDSVPHQRWRSRLKCVTSKPQAILYAK